MWLSVDPGNITAMKHGLDISPAGAWGRPDEIAELATLAEDHGWDGVFCEDYLAFPGGLPTYDVWVTLGLVAQATTRLTIGTMVTPLPARHPRHGRAPGALRGRGLGWPARARRRDGRPRGRPRRRRRLARRPPRGGPRRLPGGVPRRARVGRWRDHQASTSRAGAAVERRVPLPRATTGVGGHHARRRRRPASRRRRPVVRRGGRRTRTSRRPGRRAGVTSPRSRTRGRTGGRSTFHPG